MAEEQESSIPGVPLSESMKEFDKAHKECVREEMLVLVDPKGPKSGPVRMTEKGWRVAGYLLATMSMTTQQAKMFEGDENNESSNQLLEYGRIALDMAAWMKLNPGREFSAIDGQHR